MVRWHIEGPEKFLDLESRRIRWSQEGGDSVPVAGLAACPRHNEGVLRVMNPSIPGLLPVQDPVISVSNADRFHMGRIGSVCGFRDRHGPAPTSARHGLEPFFFLRVTATPNAAISSINYTLEIVEEKGSVSKLYSKVVGFRVLPWRRLWRFDQRPCLSLGRARFFSGVGHLLSMLGLQP